MQNCLKFHLSTSLKFLENNLKGFVAIPAARPSSNIKGWSLISTLLLSLHFILAKLGLTGSKQRAVFLKRWLQSKVLSGAEYEKGLRHCLGLLQVINLILPLRCMSGSPFQCCVWYYPESNGTLKRSPTNLTDDEYSTTKITPQLVTNLAKSQRCTGYRVLQSSLQFFNNYYSHFVQSNNLAVSLADDL